MVHPHSFSNRALSDRRIAGRRIADRRIAGRRTAFTLVEVIVAMTILMACLGFGYLLMNRTFQGLDRHKQQLDTQHEARYFLALVERDLREMLHLVKLETAFPSEFSDPKAGLFKSMTLEIPDREANSGSTEVTYSYEGPSEYQDVKGQDKIIYRQEKGRVKKAIINKNLVSMRVFGTDGTIFRPKGPTENELQYMNYLQPHFYNPSNTAANGLRVLSEVKGIEIRFEMIETTSADGKEKKIRPFITRIYSRILNAKYE